MLARISHSLSAKLLLLFVCAGAVLVLLAGATMGKGFTRHFHHSVRPFMAHYIELTERELGRPPTLQNARRIVNRIPADIHVFGPGGSWSTAREVLDRAQLTDLDAHERPRRFGFRGKAYALKKFDEHLILQTRDGEYQVYFQIHGRGIAHGGPYGVLLIGLIAGVLLLIYFATRALFRPIRDIQAGVEKIGGGDLSHRISKRRNDQLGDLTDSVNAMADDISGMLEAKRQMLLGISHELRSPLTRGMVNLELLPDSRAKDEVKKDLGAMESLIAELLESEQLNARHAALKIESTALHELIEELLREEFAAHEIRRALQPLRAKVDRLRIKLLLRNILQNAFKHGGAAAPPQISLRQDGADFVIEMRDFGRGIAREHLARLTEPFYRADPSRQRKTGGHGLGLYLCRMVVAAHHGDLQITSAPGEGARVVCRMPLAPSAAQPSKAR